MKGAWIAVLVSVVVGGCAGPPVAAPGMPGAASAMAALAFLAEPKLLGPGADAENSITVSPDGNTILACSHGGFTQPSPLWVSTDAGQTFRRVEPQPNQPFNGDCDVSIAASGAWYIVYDTAASATVGVSLDQGRTWTLTYADGLPIGGVDRPWILAGAGRTVYLNYQSIGTGGPQVQIMGVSTDGGLTWVPHVISAPSGTADFQGVGGRPFLGAQPSTVYVPIGRAASASTDDLFLAVSRDTGATWTLRKVAMGVAGQTGLVTASRALDDGTLWYASTIQKSRGVGDIVAWISHDDGSTWSPANLVVEADNVGGYPTTWIDARPDGSADLVWMRALENGTIWQPAMARVHAKPSFGVDFVETIGVPGNPTTLYEFSMVDHDASGRAYINFPLVTGPQCKETPPFPSQVGSQNIPRNNQCEYLVMG